MLGSQINLLLTDFVGGGFDVGEGLSDLQENALVLDCIRQKN